MADSSPDRFWFWFFILISLVLIVGSLILGFPQCAFFDFSVYVEAARSLTNGANPYSSKYPVVTELNEIVELYYLYPPLPAVVISWCLGLGADLLQKSWMVITFASICAGIVLLTQALTQKKTVATPWSVVALMAIMLYPPTFDGICLGQVDGAVFFLLALAAWGLANGHQATTGTAIALAGAIKCSPWILLLLLFRFRLKKAKLAFYITIGLVFVLSCLSPRGFEVWVDYKDSVGALAGGAMGWVTTNNYSLARLIYGVIPGLEVRQAALLAQILCLPLLAMLFFSRTSNRSENKMILYSGLICLMVLFPPILWFHHLLWMIIPAMAVIKLKPIGFYSTVIGWISLVLLATGFLVDKYLTFAGFDPSIPGVVGPAMVITPVLLLYFTLLSKLRVIT